MSSQQKTFSIAVSRQMAPIARVLAYYMTAGEVVVDALNFYVKDVRLTSVRRLNYKDFLYVSSKRILYFFV